MSTKVLVDTGPLYALADISDQYHSRAERETKRLTKQKRTVVVAYPTLFESHKLILYRLGTQYAHRWLGEVLESCGLLNPGEVDYGNAMRLIAAYADQPLTLSDTVLAALSDRLGIPVWTYDHHFNILSVRRWP